LNKINQDSYLNCNFEHKNDIYNIFGIFDGHGTNGHLISQLTKKLMEAEIKRLIMKGQIMDANRIHGSFQKIQRDILNEKIDSSLSGTTALLIVVVNDTLVEINLGDSEYGLYTFEDNNLKLIYNNDLHNFSNQKELDRVKNSKCVIKPLMGKFIR